MKLRVLLALGAFGGLVACGETTAPVTTATVIDFGNNSSQWALDGECDDPRFIGPASATTLLAEDAFRDATDCKLAFELGLVAYRG